MLVADAFDPVCSESISEKGRTLECLSCADLYIRILRLEVVSRSERAAGSCRGYVSLDVLLVHSELFQDLDDCGT